MSTSWDPPNSPHNLLQWHVRHDPWKVLVACVFCNMTRRSSAEPLFWKFFERWPTPESAAEADENEIEDLIRNLGLSKRKAQTLKRMSAEYLQDDWEDPIQLYGCGKYASDAWHIFCVGDWREVEPNDHALNWYHEFLREKFGG